MKFSIIFFQNGIKLSSAKRPRTRSQAAREKLKEDRENITLWKQPITTINYSTRELCITLLEWGQKSFEYKKTLALLSVIISLAVVLYRVDGPHKQVQHLPFKKSLQFEMIHPVVSKT